MKGEGVYTIEKKVTETKQLRVKPCNKCGKAEVKTWDCGYSSFNVCGVECKHCGREFKRNGDWTEEELIKEWNRYNGKLTLQKRVDLLREQIKRLGKEPEA